MNESRLTPQQQAVVDNRGGTLLVSAAAGSGKTKVLVDRVMSRITQEGKNIDQFLIITFTNAAAAELRGKISDAISRAMAAQPGNRHLQRQMNLLSLAQISTVHAFCGSLIRQYGYLLEIPSDYSMLEDAQREIMLDRILDEILEEKYSSGESGFLALADTLGAGRNDIGLADTVKAVFETLLSQPYPEEWLGQQVFSLEPDRDVADTLWGKVLVEQAKTQVNWILQRYDWAISAMEDDEVLSRKYLPAYVGQRTAISAIPEALDGPWDQIAGAFEIEYPRVSAPKYPDQDFLEDIKAVKNDGKKVLDKLKLCFSRNSEELILEQNQMAPALESLVQLVAELYKRFLREKRKKNLLDFSDQEHYAISLLLDKRGAPTWVAEEVSERFAEIMVDEYQDSNRVQELIYCAICRGNDENRFLVGDVKQSIYGFRQAEPEMFLEKYGSYTPGERAADGQQRSLVLSRNFRSRPEILEAVNHTFRTVMGQDLGGLEYSDDQMLYPGLEEYSQDGQCHVELNVLALEKLPGGRDDESNKYLREAQWVSNRIVSLLEQQVPVRDGDRTRPVRPQDIAILFRSRDAMRYYQRALEQAGIPVVSDTGEDLFETPEVQVLMNFLRVLDNPHQDIPMLAVLCCPVFRLSNQQLSQIRLASKARRFYDALAESELDFAKELIKKLHVLRKEAKQRSAEALVWHLLYDVGLLTLYSAMDGGEVRRQNLLQIYSIACKASGGEYLYLHELVAALDRQAQHGLERSGSTGKGVVLTTIHKSKGLEYPVVFLCDLSRKLNFRELRDNILVDGDMGIGARITDVQHRTRHTGFVFEALKVKKREKLMSEEIRVLYVAMTRPKDYLFMTYASSEAESALKRLVRGAGVPTEDWARHGCGCLGDWVLLSALNRVEAGELFSAAGRPRCQLKVSDNPWGIHVHTIGVPEKRRLSVHQETEGDGKYHIPSVPRLVDSFLWEYSHKQASYTPSKLTATQLKGRTKDTEAAEDTVTSAPVPQLKRPDFILEKLGMTAAERGTAAHLFLQYADYHRLTDEDGVLSELDRLADDLYITRQQADSVSPEMMVKLFTSELGERLRKADKLVREFKFSMLVPAEKYFSGLDGEEVLLQGVVDAAILDSDGIVILDFKTDRVFGEAMRVRAREYYSQLETYKYALEKIFHLPVKEMILYFLQSGESVHF